MFAQPITMTTLVMKKAKMSSQTSGRERERERAECVCEMPGNTQKSNEKEHAYVANKFMLGEL